MKNTKFNTLETKVNQIKKIPDATTLIHIDQYNRDQQYLEKNNGDVSKNTRITLGDYNKLPKHIVHMMIKKEKLAIKDDFAKKTDFHKYLRKLNKKFTLK